MDEEEQDEGGNERGRLARNGAGGEWPNPENGSVGALVLLGHAAERALIKHLDKVINCVLDSIDGKSLAGVKFLVELVRLVNAGVEVPMETYESLAEILTKSWKEEQERQGQGTRD